MKHKSLALMLVGSMLLISRPTFSQQNTTPLTNSDVTSMVSAGLSEATIIGTLQARGGNFDVSPDSLIALSKAGVPMHIIELMTATGIIAKHPDVSTPDNASVGTVPTPTGVASSFVEPPETGAASAISVPQPERPTQKPGQAIVASGSLVEQQPTVSLLADGPMPLMGERLQSVQITTKGSMNLKNALNQMASAGFMDVANRETNGNGLESMSAGFNILGGLFSHANGVSIYLWALRGRLSVNSLQLKKPTFEVSFADMAGVDPDEFEPRMVRLESTKNNLRLLGTTRVTNQSGSSNNGTFGASYSDFFEHEVDTHKEVTQPGHMRLVPVAELQPGEYAVVIRPVFSKRKFSGDAISRNDGEGMLFNMAWSFSVK